MTKPVTIQDVQTILTQPAGSRLIVVKLVTSEPGLYGLGCATFTQRFHAVHRYWNAASRGLDLQGGHGAHGLRTCRIGASGP